MNNLKRLYLVEFNKQHWIATENGILFAPKSRDKPLSSGSYNLWEQEINWFAIQPLEIIDRNSIKYLEDWQLAAEVSFGSDIGQLYLKLKEEIDNLGGISASRIL